MLLPDKRTKIQYTSSQGGHEDIKYMLQNAIEE
jgi:hypothetical protein